MTSFNFTALRSLSLISGLCLALLAPSVAKAGCIDTFTDALSGTGVIASTGLLVSDIQGGLAGVTGGSRTTTVISAVHPIRATSVFIDTTVNRVV